MEPLSKQQQELAAKSIESAKRIAERYARLFPEYSDEFESIAAWGAMRAAASYQPELGGVWRQWLKTCVKGEIQDFLGSSYVRTRCVWDTESLDEFAVLDQDDPREMYAALHALLRRLSKKQRRVCSLIYVSGLSPDVVAIAMGVTPGRVRRLHQSALNYLRKALAA